MRLVTNHDSRTFYYWGRFNSCHYWIIIIIIIILLPCCRTRVSDRPASRVKLSCHAVLVSAVDPNELMYTVVCCPSAISITSMIHDQLTPRIMHSTVRQITKRVWRNYAYKKCNITRSVRAHVPSKYKNAKSLYNRCRLMRRMYKCCKTENP